MQRRVYYVLQGEQLYANLFVMLVGPPGVGKTRAIRPVREALGSLGTLTLSPSKTTKEKMLDRLAKATRNPGRPDSHTSYMAAVDELSTFIRPADLEFTDILTDLYDSPKIWTYEAIKEDRRVENLFFSLLGGIATQTLATNFRPIFGRGFTARVNLIFSDEGSVLDIHAKPIIPDFKPLHRELQRIGKLSGQITIETKAGRAIQDWLNGGMVPAPKNFRFAEYNARRSLHLLKLCMIHSVSESDSLVIEMKDFESARATLLGAERDMVRALEFMSGNTLAESVRLAHQWMTAEFNENKESISDQRVRQHLLMEIGPQYVDVALQQMVASNMIVKTIVNEAIVYRPVARQN